MRLLHHKWLGSSSTGSEREVRHQTWVDDHVSLDDSIAANCGWHVEEGLAWWSRGLRQHHSFVDWCRKGCRQGNPRSEGKANRHGIEGANHRCVGGRLDVRAGDSDVIRGDLCRDEAALG